MSNYNLNLEVLKGPWFGPASHDGHNIQPIFSMIVKLCVINTDSVFDKSTVDIGYKADGTFAKCDKPWFGKLFWCKSCNSQPILLCNNCAEVCHQSCERELAVFRTFLHVILQYNPCSCVTSGCCKLKSPARSLLPRILHHLQAIACGVSLIIVLVLIFVSAVISVLAEGIVIAISKMLKSRPG